MFDTCDKRGNMFNLSREQKIDFFYDHLASSGLYGDHFGYLTELRAEIARRALPAGDPGRNVERPCEGCNLQFCKLWTERPHWAAPHEVFTMTEANVRERNPRARATAGIYIQGKKRRKKKKKGMFVRPQVLRHTLLIAVF
jgi:hypothetical protein